ncbi:unnamed protein product [Penicillium nalgiovense]|nr:unnamed protein product [Penicillium nalgiovense]
MGTRDLFSFEHMSYTRSPQYPSGSPMGMVDRCFETGSENNVVDEGPPPAPLALSTYSTPPLPPRYRTIKPRLSDCGLMPNNNPPPRMTRWELSLGGIEGVERAGIANGSHKRKMASLSQSNPRRMPAWSLLLDPGARALVADRPAYHHDVPCSLDLSDIQVSWPNSFFELSQDRDSMRAASLQFSEHLERTQVLQSLSILQDYMAKYPSVFERQAPEMVQRWMLDIEGVKPPESLSE